MTDRISFESLADQAGFTMMPNCVLLASDISAQAKVLYACFVHHARAEGGCYPGQERLGSYLGLSERQVRDYTRELERHGLIETARTRTTNHYLLKALGRWEAKRQSDRRDSAGQTGEIPPMKKTQEKKTPSGGNNAREALLDSPQIKFGGKPVKPDVWAQTLRVLDVYNEVAGQALGALTSGGQPSEAAKRIYSTLVRWPDFSIEKHRDVIERTLASKWWGEERPHPGVVFGVKVFEQNLHREPTSKHTKEADRRARDARRMAAFKRVTGQA